jgi:hypothetical protein
MLGYKPFFKEYTTDWDYAVAKMKGSYFQRHLVEDSYSKAKSWEEQSELSSRGKPTNAEFEQWTVDLSPGVKRDKNGAIEVNGVSSGANTNSHSDASPDLTTSK